MFQHYHIYLEQHTRNPMKERMDSSKHSEAICGRDAGQKSEMFLDNLSGQKVYSPKPCQWTLQKAVVDSPFCSWTVRSAEKSHFGENSPTDDFGGSKMGGFCLGPIFVGVPVFALGV